ncbi:hypothetical protein DFJ74DRAFT_757259 [Hyaloraphidium curvatum]|nr:hypothetical protein DFJ74DRAFT_757259 [Hyaloraphidium curvatum]
MSIGQNASPGPASRQRIALLYPGDCETRDISDPSASRFAALFDAFARSGVDAEPAVWNDDFAGEVAAQLRDVRAVLCWCNPIEGGRRRDVLDAVLADAAAAGVLVSAHPEAVRRLGTKDVLLDTRQLPFGSDVHRVDSLQQLEKELPDRLAKGPRVLKQHRGHSGIGVYRVELSADGSFHVRHAQRGSEPFTTDLPGIFDTLAPYFDAAAGGHMIDQAWQPRLRDGMIRAYMVGDTVAGFGHQAVNALHPDVPQPGQRVYYGPDWPEGQELKAHLEGEGGWVAQLRERVGLAQDKLPLLWDADFMFGESAPGEPQRYVVCEINVSSISPFPPSAIDPLVAAVKERLAGS